jgi:transposase
MTNFSELRVFLCMTPTSMNFSFDRLMGLAERVFNQDPLSGHLFLFLNRGRNLVKILYWDRDGFCIWYKRLEEGVFELPKSNQEGVELDYQQLSRLLGGLDLRSGRRRQRRYRRPVSDNFSKRSSLIGKSG